MRFRRATVTVGRRAPTRSASVWCESRKGRTAPSGAFRPHSSVNCHRLRQQALLDPDGVGDRRADSEPARSLQRAIGERLQELGTSLARAASGCVENRDRRRLDHRPGEPLEKDADLVLPGTEQVAPPEQLQAPTSLGHQNPASDHPVEHQHSEMVDRGLPRVRLPGPALELHTPAERGPPWPSAHHGAAGHARAPRPARAGQRGSRSVADWLLAVAAFSRHADPVPGVVCQKTNMLAERPSSRRRSPRIDPISTATATGPWLPLIRPIAGFRLARPRGVRSLTTARV